MGICPHFREKEGEVSHVSIDLFSRGWKGEREDEGGEGGGIEGKMGENLRRVFEGVLHVEREGGEGGVGVHVPAEEPVGACLLVLGALVSTSRLSFRGRLFFVSGWSSRCLMGRKGGREEEREGNSDIHIPGTGSCRCLPPRYPCSLWWC